MLRSRHVGNVSRDRGKYLESVREGMRGFWRIREAYTFGSGDVRNIESNDFISFYFCPSSAAAAHGHLFCALLRASFILILDQCRQKAPEVLFRRLVS
jgi:hypothetical protein